MNLLERCRLKPWEAAAVAALVVVGAFLRFWRLGTDSLWMDEAYSLSVAKEGFGAIWAHQDQTPPLWDLLLHVWIQLFGTSEVALRFPAALCGTLAVAVTFPVARRITSSVRAALAATGFHALSFYLWNYSQEARTYPLFVLLGLLSMLAFLRLREQWTPRRAAAYVGATALLLYSHVFGLFLVAAQNVAVLLDPATTPWTSRRWLGPQAVVALLFAPWAPTLLARTGATLGSFWLPGLSLERVASSAVWLSGSALAAAVFGFLLVCGVLRVRPWRREPGLAGTRLALLWLLVPQALAIFAALLTPIYRPKYLLATAPALFILAGQGLASMRPTLRGCVAIAAAMVLLVPTVQFHANPASSLHRDDWRGLVHDLDARAARGETVLWNTGVCDSSTTDDRLCVYDYYANRTDLRQIPVFVNQPVTAQNVVAVDNMTAGLHRVWLAQVFLVDWDGHLEARLAALGFRTVQDQSYVGMRLRLFERA